MLKRYTELKHLRFSDVTEEQRALITSLMGEDIKKRINHSPYVRATLDSGKPLREVGIEPNSPWLMLMMISDMLVIELEPLGLEDVNIDPKFYLAPHGRLLTSLKIKAGETQICEAIYETLEQMESATPELLCELFQQLVAERKDGIITYLTAVVSRQTDETEFCCSRNYLVQDIRQIIIGTVPLFDVMAALSVDLELAEDRKLHLKMKMRPRANKGEFFVDVSITIQL